MLGGNQIDARGDRVLSIVGQRHATAKRISHMDAEAACSKRLKDKAFHRWLKTLNWETFRVEFVVDDLDLLSQMVQLQLPLPTPLHPKAVPLQASRKYSPVAWFCTEESARRDYQRLLKLVHSDERMVEFDEINSGCARKNQISVKGKGTRHRRQMKIGVIARQHRMPDGTLLSRPLLHKRIEVDNFLVCSSRLVLLDDVDVADNPRYLCRLEWTDLSRYSVMELLRIASCGNFGIRTDYSSYSLSLTASSWLNPFERWFTLAQYLAFCYEGALRRMFREERQSQTMSPTVFHIDVDGKDGMIQWYSVIAQAFRQLLWDECMSVFPYTRDSLLCCCLLDPIDIPFKEVFHPSNFCCFPLVDLGTSVMQWKQLLQKQWLVVRSIRAEVSLLKDHDLSDDTNVMSNTSTNEKAHKTKKRRSKRKQHSRTEDHQRTKAAVARKNSPDGRDRLLALDTDMNDESRMITNILTLDRSLMGHKKCADLPNSELQDEIDSNESAGFQVVTKRNRKAMSKCVKKCTTQQPFFRKDFGLAVEFREMDDKLSQIEDIAIAPLHITDDSLFPSLDQFHYDEMVDPTATIRVSNTTSNHRYDATGDFPLSDILPGYNGDSWILTDFSTFGFGSGWHRELNRGKSILNELLDGQSKFDRDDSKLASSTAASIASSLKDETIEIVLADGTEFENEIDKPSTSQEDAAFEEDCSYDGNGDETRTHTPKIVDTVPNEKIPRYAVSEISPSPPSTPSPTLSPILMSLSDLSTMNKHSMTSLGLGPGSLCSDPTTKKVRSDHATCGRSIDAKSSHGERLPVSNRQDLNGTGRPSKLSIASRSFHMRSKARDDCDLATNSRPCELPSRLPSHQGQIVRSESARDDTDVRLLASTSTLDGKTRTRKLDCSRINISPQRPPRYFQIETLSTLDRGRMKISTTRSETALEDDEIGSHEWQSKATRDLDDNDNNTLVSRRDVSIAHLADNERNESEDLRILREEKNMFQDMCLTLGAEVAKLRSVLAAQSGGTAGQPGVVPANTRYLTNASRQFNLPFTPESFPIAPRAKTMAAMSDAGYRVDNDSIAGAEDDVLGKLHSQDPRHVSSSATVAESDASLDPSSVYNIYQMPVGIQNVRQIQDPIAPHGIRSRLSDDIAQFLDNIELKLNKLEAKRRIAIERMTRLVESVWPRAQVNLFGSHSTGLCIPSSDLDFVVCLPAVHKNAVAVAPGVLEGRNAINESSQKLLARRLKGESWIDPRSMKIIERTTTPVIKVATKDTKAKTLHLDISFEGPGHHGLEAARMIKSVVEEIPCVRPLCLVLKQFLIDRGLLEAYTGGLSSYCLFLMVTRYLQEQNNLDLGSLLMGFLDFFGNHFDFAATGISVRRRQYFPRPSYYTSISSSQQFNVWRPPATATVAVVQSQMLNASHRRKSFSDKQNHDRVPNGSIISLAGIEASTVSASRVHESYGLNLQSQNPNVPSAGIEGSQAMPYTFDPLFVEDPLSDGNNVGRNAFRIFQVQRAFSDAHRALVAALEWDAQSAHEEARALPLLKCLFQNEEDHIFSL